MRARASGKGRALSTKLLRPARRFAAPALGVSLALSALSAVGVAAAGPANAVTDCAPTHRLDCKDPEAMGCASGATNAASTTRSVGGRTVTFELRWSGACTTNWVRVRNWPSGRTKLQIDVGDIWRGSYAKFAVPRPIGAGTHWGNMVYSPAASCAIGGVDYAGDDAYEVVLQSSECGE
jgi:Protein of unknown function (DUF2690)